MSVLDRLNEEMKAAMRSKDAERLSAIRMLISAIRYVEIDNPGMTEEQMIEVLRREAKKRRESVEAYKAGGRPELAEKEEYELKLIEGYLPAQMSEDEVRAKTKEVLAGKEFPAMGQAIGAVMKELKGKADGGLVSRIVREVYDQH